MINIFKKFFYKYKFEIVITIIGISLSILTGIMDGIDNITDSQLLICYMTFLSDILSLTIKSIKVELIEDINKESRFWLYKSKIPECWKERVDDLEEKLVKELKAMSEKELSLRKSELIEHQVRMLENAKNKVYAIHLAKNEMAIRRWDKQTTTKDFSNVLIAANSKIRRRVKKRRLFILDETLVDCNEELKKLWNQILEEQKKELKFKVRVLTTQSIENAEDIVEPQDILLCDKEIVTVHFVDGIAEGKVYYDRSEVKKGYKNFEQLWTISEPQNKKKANISKKTK